MSIPIPRTAACPRCGSQISYTMWASINTEEENALPDLISGKLFQVRCDHCGLQTHVDYPILFNDMIHQVMIFCCRPEKIPETEKACNNLRDYCAAVRIVTSQNELREKAMIFNDGLDDRMIELLKVLMLPRLQELLPDQEIREVYYFSGDRELTLQLLFDSGSSMAELTRQHYETVDRVFRPFLNDEKTEHLIDRSWAEAFLKNKQAS